MTKLDRLLDDLLESRAKELECMFRRIRREQAREQAKNKTENKQIK